VGALAVVWSPLLHNSLQNGVTRQALATTVLITPVLVWAAGWGKPNWIWLGVAVLVSAFGPSQPAGNSRSGPPLPLLTHPAVLEPVRWCLPALPTRTRWIAGSRIALGVLILLLLIGPLLTDKLEFYFRRSS